MGRGQLVDDGIAGCDALRGVDDHSAHRHVPGQLKELITVRRLCTVVPPDAAEHRGAVGVVGLHQPAHQRAVDGGAFVAAVFVGAHRHLEETAGHHRWFGEGAAGVLAQSVSLHGDQRVGQLWPQFGQCGIRLGCGAHADHDQRYVGVAAEEPRPPTLAGHGAVDPEKHLGGEESEPVQHLADTEIPGRACDALPAAQIHRQTHVLAGSRVGQGAATLEGQHATVQYVGHLIGQRNDAVRAVHGGESHRRVLGQAQRAIAAHHMGRAEARDTAQHDAGGDRPLVVAVQQLLGQKAATVPLTFGEIRCQRHDLGAGRVHSSPAIVCPA